MNKLFTLLVVLFLPSLLVAQTPMPRSLSVQGSAQVKITADKATISVDIFEKATDYNTCYSNLQKKHEIFKSELKKEGIDISKLRASNLRINENYDYTDKGAQKNGYEASITLIYETEYSNEIINKLITTLNKSTLGYRYNVNFSLSDEKTKQYRSQLMTQAVTDARAKALILAEASQCKLGDIYNISYNDPGPVTVQTRMYKAEMLSVRANSSNTQEQIELTPGTIELNETVSIIWLLQ
jgi:uncharacterized protein YggE